MPYKYTNSIVAFIDLLGFRDLVEKTINEKNQKRISDIISNIDKGLKSGFGGSRRSGLVRENKYNVTMFSDCICFSCAYNDPKRTTLEDILGSFLFDVILCLAHLVEISIMTRGAITIGKHFQNERLIFSPALIHAYDIESKEAIYPRVIVHESILNEVIPYFPEDSYVVEDWFRKDIDGRYFLNYLADEVITLTHRDIFIWHKKMIEHIASQNRTNYRILEKCRWCATYHNQRITEYMRIYGTCKKYTSLLKNYTILPNLRIDTTKLFAPFGRIT